MPQPEGRPLLEISGRITATNRNAAAVFDRAMLEKLGLRTLRTGTAWTDGVKVFEGVLVRDLLAAVGAERATMMRAVALNDYVVDIPLSDFQRYDAIIALSMDGRELTARDKGPLWIVYPRDQFGELQDERYDARWIWQLKQLILS
ncbi:hypothetical protein DWF00_12810 [Bosea caraganae]|uniref:Oxidoreductase molybdopterin-binding domain-containing protein n=1 Tax=Bosea caraganae TaxID=2763117 RepID=A0A370LD79_9HYPH|nr:hypothetical protein DWF00_12810 [Bosea caraganae]RDJ29934.1 hypothetical protein DWE98_04580 [Bosea caraganae]